MIEIVRKKHPSNGIEMDVFKSGDKILFAQVFGGDDYFFHYFYLSPETLTKFFKIPYQTAEKYLLEWVELRTDKDFSDY